MFTNLFVSSRHSYIQPRQNSLTRWSEIDSLRILWDLAATLSNSIVIQTMLSGKNYETAMRNIKRNSTIGWIKEKSNPLDICVYEEAGQHEQSFRTPDMTNFVAYKKTPNLQWLLKVTSSVWGRYGYYLHLLLCEIFRAQVYLLFIECTQLDDGWSYTLYINWECLTLLTLAESVQERKDFHQNI